jgi:hypothetical protein
LTTSGFPRYSTQINATPQDSTGLEAVQRDAEVADLTAYMRGVARANGFNSLTEAIAGALKWRSAQSEAARILDHARNRERHYASQPESRHTNRMKDFQVGKVAGLLELLESVKP